MKRKNKDTFAWDDCTNALRIATDHVAFDSIVTRITPYVMDARLRGGVEVLASDGVLRPFNNRMSTVRALVALPSLKNTLEGERIKPNPVISDAVQTLFETRGVQL